MSSMINLTDQRSYHLYRKETDMRKGFNLLCGIVVNELGRKVTGGDAFIFINKPRTHLKLLVYEQGGFTIFFFAGWRKVLLKCLLLTWMQRVCR